MEKLKIKCVKCGSENLKFSVNLSIYAPIKFIRKLSKRALRSKDIKLWGADWENLTIYCSACGHTNRTGDLPKVDIF